MNMLLLSLCVCTLQSLFRLPEFYREVGWPQNIAWPQSLCCFSEYSVNHVSLYVSLPSRRCRCCRPCMLCAGEASASKGHARHHLQSPSRRTPLLAKRALHCGRRSGRRMQTAILIRFFIWFRHCSMNEPATRRAILLMSQHLVSISFHTALTLLSFLF